MWPRRTKALYIGLSRDRADWQLAGEASHSAALAAGDDGLRQLFAAVDASVGPAQIHSVHAVLGSSLARHWLQTAPPGLTSMTELQELVRSRAEQLFGSDPGWVVAADWHAHRPFLCAAAPREVNERVAAVAQAKRATPRLSTSLSLALAHHARRLPANGWVALHEPEALHLLHLSGNRLDQVRTVSVDAALSADELESLSVAEVTRASALAGGLPASPLTILSMVSTPAATQANAALKLAVQASGAHHDPRANLV